MFVVYQLTSATNSNNFAEKDFFNFGVLRPGMGLVSAPYDEQPPAVAAGAAATGLTKTPIAAWRLTFNGQVRCNLLRVAYCAKKLTMQITGPCCPPRDRVLYPGHAVPALGQEVLRPQRPQLLLAPRAAQRLPGLLHHHSQHAWYDSHHTTSSTQMYAGSANFSRMHEASITQCVRACYIVILTKNHQITGQVAGHLCRRRRHHARSRCCSSCC